MRLTYMYLVIVLFFCSLAMGLVETNRVAQLKLEIKKTEERLYSMTNGYPDRFSGPSNENTSNVIARLQEVWSNYDSTISNINTKKLELKKFQ